MGGWGGGREGEAPNVMVQIVQVPIGGFKSILASCYVSLSSSSKTMISFILSRVPSKDL